MAWIFKMFGALWVGFTRLSSAEKFGLVTGAMSLTDTILTKIVGHDLKAEVLAVIVGEVAAKTGLQLDPAEPWSDASIAGALSQRTGIPIRSVKDRAMILEDIDDYAAGRVSEKLGYRISTFRDPVRMRADFDQAALAVLTAKTGIPFSPLAEGEALTAASIKDQIKDWARAELMLEMQGKAGEALAALGGPDVDFEALAAEMNGKLEALGSLERVTAGRVAMRVAESLVRESVSRFETTAADGSKRDRRAAQLRAAQRKFRATHGNRVQYVPLGMTGTIT